MKQILTAERSVVIHDFDGVHYDYADHPNIYSFLGGANAKAIVRLFPELTLQEAQTIAVESYHTHHNGFSGFVPYAEKAGWDEESFRLMHSREYHRQSYADLIADFPDYIRSCADTLPLFERLRGRVRHCLLTQSDLEYWAKPLLSSMNYLQYFEPEGLLGFVECNGHYKAKSTYPLSLALSVMKAEPEQVVFVEDSLQNLEMAKQLGKILTVYVHHGKTLDQLPAYVDVQIEKPKVIMAEIADLIVNPLQDNRLEPVNGVLPSLDLACK